MDFGDPYTLIGGIMFGFVGMWMFKAAKEKSNFPLFMIAATLCVYPYFISDPTICWGTGFALCWGASKVW